MNDTTLVIYASNCEVGTTCSLAATSSGGTTWYTGITCQAGGSFQQNISTPITRGVQTSFVAYCTDSTGNDSADSNTVVTEACAVEDPWEDSSGAGDASSYPIEPWSNGLDDLAQDAGSTVGTILKEAGTWDSDWYVVDTTDSGSASDTNNIYNLRVNIASAVSNLYTFKVHKGSNTAADLECSSSTSGYTEYNDCVRDNGDNSSASYHVGNGTNSCQFSTSAHGNYCDTMTSTYYIEIIRDTSAAASCASYSLSVSNGLTQTGSDTCEQ
jgi:hypothetical protein